MQIKFKNMWDWKKIFEFYSYGFVAATTYEA